MEEVTMTAFTRRGFIQGLLALCAGAAIARRATAQTYYDEYGNPVVITGPTTVVQPALVVVQPAPVVVQPVPAYPSYAYPSYGYGYGAYGAYGGVYGVAGVRGQSRRVARRTSRRTAYRN